MLKTFVSRKPIEVLLRWQAMNLNDPILLEAISVPGNYGLLSSMEYVTPDRLVKDLFVTDAEILIRGVNEELSSMGDDEKCRFYEILSVPRKDGNPEPFTSSAYPYFSLLTNTKLAYSQHSQAEQILGWDNPITLNDLQLKKWDILECGAGKTHLYKIITELRDELFPGTQIEIANNEVTAVYWLYMYLSYFVNTATVIEAQQFESWLQLWNIYVDLHDSLKNLEAQNTMGTTKEASHA